MSAEIESANPMTGEILDADEAEQRAADIAFDLDVVADGFEEVMKAMRRSIELRDDLALGYRSPGDYVSDRFGGRLARLGVDLRREVVRELTAAGLSTRAIAPVVGVSREAVRRDVERLAGDNTVSPQSPEPATGGEAMASSIPPLSDIAYRCPRCNTSIGMGYPGYADMRAQHEAGRCNPAGPVAATPVVGIDGKTYTAKTQPTPRRRPLPDSFWTAVYDAEKRIQTLRNLTTDDRWTQNAEKVAAAHRNDLLRINDLLQQVINSLPDRPSSATAS